MNEGERARRERQQLGPVPPLKVFADRQVKDTKHFSRAVWLGRQQLDDQVDTPRHLLTGCVVFQP